MTKPTKWVCAQWRLRSAWASAQSDQSLRYLHEETLGPYLPTERTAKTLIRLGGCPGRYESSLGAHSFCWFCHVVAQVRSFGHLTNCCNYPGIWIMWFYHRVMPTKHSERTVNRVNPDCSQRSSLIWVYTVCSDLSVWSGSTPFVQTCQSDLGLHCLLRLVSLIWVYTVCSDLSWYQGKHYTFYFVYNKKKIQIFVMNMTYLPHEVKKKYTHEIYIISLHSMQ